MFKHMFKISLLSVYLFIPAHAQAAVTRCFFVASPCDAEGNHYQCRVFGWTGTNKIKFCSEFDRSGANTMYDSSLSADELEGSKARHLTAVATGGYPGTFGSCHFDSDLSEHAIERAQAEALKQASENCDNLEVLSMRAVRAELKACTSWTPYYEATVELIYVCQH